MKTRTVGISAIIFICCLLTACSPTIADNTTLQPDGSVSDAVIDSVVTPAVETITRRQAVEDIVSLLDGVSSDQSAADYAETHGLLLMLNEQDWDAAISYRDAAVLLYEALSHGTHHFTLETVSNQSHVDALSPEDNAARALMFLYRWGILYGEPSEDWYASISENAFHEILNRLQNPALRAELLPDDAEKIASKLGEAYCCSCIQGCEEQELLVAKDGFQTLLLEQPTLSTMLQSSYWFLERDEKGTFYLTAFTQTADNQLAYSRYTYCPDTNEGQVSTEQILEPYDWSAERILYAVCMNEAQKEQLISTDLEEYRTFLRENPADATQFEDAFLAAWAIPRQSAPALMFIGLRDGSLMSETFFNKDHVNYVCDQLADSWYHIYD